MSEQNKPALLTFQMKHEDFYYLGVEFKRGSVDYWNEFDKMGGWQVITKYQKTPYEGAMMTIWQYNDPENQIYFPGRIVENVDNVPEGFTLKKFSACEFIIITTEWVNGSVWSGSAQTALENKDNAQLIPDGYERYGGSENLITLIERENQNAESGNRYEVWVPIRRSE